MCTFFSNFNLYNVHVCSGLSVVAGATAFMFEVPEKIMLSRRQPFTMSPKMMNMHNMKGIVDCFQGLSKLLSALAPLLCRLHLKTTLHYSPAFFWIYNTIRSLITRFWVFLVLAFTQNLSPLIRHDSRSRIQNGFS